MATSEKSIYLLEKAGAKHTYLGYIEHVVAAGVRLQALRDAAESARPDRTASNGRWDLHWLPEKLHSTTLREIITAFDNVSLEDTWQVPPDLDVLTEGDIDEMGTPILVYTPQVAQHSDGPNLNPDAFIRYTREQIAAAARKRQSPSTEATLDYLIGAQVDENLAAIHNWRPMGLSRPPVTIYHPVFVTFLDGMRQPVESIQDFTADELDKAMELMHTSLDHYDDKPARVEALRKSQLFATLGWSQPLPRCQPDRATVVKLPESNSAVTSITEVKNEMGTGNSDPIMHAECMYAAVYSSQQYANIREKTCCPAFLIGIAGPNITVSGAVFTDAVVAQRLMNYMFLGPSPCSEMSASDRGVRRVAQLFRTLKRCLCELEQFYVNFFAQQPSQGADGGPRRLPAGSCQIAESFVSPHFCSFVMDDGSSIAELKYLGLASAYATNVIYKATMTSPKTGPVPVAVKFTNIYGKRGHEILANAQPRALAPKLWFCERVPDVGGLFVVVMDFIVEERVSARRGRTKASDALSKPKNADDLRTAVGLLHAQDLVFGDLREPNILETSEGIVLIDFDWCGQAGVARYPCDINKTDIVWHEDVRRGGIMQKVHDEFLLDLLITE